MSTVGNTTWQRLPTELKLGILSENPTLAGCASVSREFKVLVDDTIQTLGFHLAAQCPGWQEVQQFAPRQTRLTMTRFKELTTQLRSEITDAEYQAISEQHPNPFSVEHIRAMLAQARQNNQDTALLALWDHIFPSLQPFPVPLPLRDVAAIRAWMADPQTLPQRQAINSVSLNGLQLRVVPREIGQLTQLQELNLYNNQIRVIPPEIGQLTHLQWLSLSYNQISVIPREIIGQLTQLQGLYLYHNQISVIPGEIGQLTQLQRLNLCYNQISALPPQFARLTSLTYLGTTGNPIGAFSPAAARRPAPGISKWSIGTSLAVLGSIAVVVAAAYRYLQPL